MKVPRARLGLALAALAAATGCRSDDMQPTLDRLGEAYDEASFQLQRSMHRAEFELERFGFACELAYDRSVHHVGRAMDQLGRAIRALGEAADDLNRALEGPEEPPPPITP